MVSSIYLNDKLGISAQKIDYIIAYDVLTYEFVSQ